ncbi:MAG: glycosyltransferase [bacterium]
MSNHSFAVVAYKDSPYLEECLKSLQRQSYQSSIMVFTSTPSSYIESMCNNLNVRMEINPHRASIAEDWSFAFNRSSTKYVTLAHQDDIYMPEYAQICMNSMNESKKKVLLIFTNYREILDNSMVRALSPALFVKRILLNTASMFGSGFNSIFTKKMLLSLGNMVSCPTVMYNKELIGEFNFSSAYSYNLDWDAWLRFSDMDGAYRYIKRPVVSHRIHSSSETNAHIMSENRRKEEKDIFRRIWPYPIADIISFMYAFGSRSSKV